MAAMKGGEATVTPTQIIPFAAMALLNVAISIAMTVFGIIWLYFAAKTNSNWDSARCLKPPKERELRT